MIRIPAVAVIVLTISVMGVAGCGESASEKIAEKAVEEMTGAKDVEVGKDGESISFKNDKGEEVSLTGGEGTKLPDGFPKDTFPLPDGAKITAAVKMAADSQGDQFTVSADVKMSPEDVLSFYKDELDGFKQESSISSADGSGFATYASSEYSATVTVSETNGNTTMTLMVSPPVKP